MAAPRFTEPQVEELRAALGKAGEVKTARGLVEALVAAEVAALSREELAGAAAAVEKLERARGTVPAWPSAASRGLFVVFEGLDRSGKSTQSKLLCQALEKEGQAKWTCFPNRSTPIGGIIDLYLRRQLELSDEVIHQLFSANRWEVMNDIVEDLNRGVSIICDRYAFSGVAYSAAKNLDFDWCKLPDSGLPVPDSIFFLHIDANVGKTRAGFGDERYENAEFQLRVREEFKKPELTEGVPWVDVEGAREIDVIHSEILGVIRGIQLENQENKRPIVQLWTA